LKPLIESPKGIRAFFGLILGLGIALFWRSTSLAQFDVPYQSTSPSEANQHVIPGPPLDGVSLDQVESLPFLDVSVRSPASQGLEIPMETIEEFVETPVPRGTRDGIFQSAHFISTWLPPLNDGEPRIVELSTYAVFALPCPTRDSPLILTPGYETYFFSQPEPVDLPDAVHGAYLEVRWLKKLTDAWGMDLSVMPGVYSDFEQDTGEGFRIPARALVSVDSSPALKWVAGVVYLDRNDISFLPAGGLIWTPHDDVRYDLVFPKPKIAWRFRNMGDVEDWCYLAGEFGGGAWSVERTDGSADILYERDYRFLVGVERKHFGWFHSRIETGFVFGRAFEYDSDGSEIELDPTILLRAALRY
jgi:hypothetical protein